MGRVTDRRSVTRIDTSVGMDMDPAIVAGVMAGVPDISAVSTEVRTPASAVRRMDTLAVWKASSLWNVYDSPVR